jgi:uncharacterized membrane protein YphA (DoxX/SURF4 family)
MTSNIKRLDSLQWILRLVYGLVPVIAGGDKFFDALTNWTQYVSPSVTRFLPFSAPTFMHIVGTIEIAAGIVVLSRFTALGAHIVSAWLTLIALSLIVSGHYLDIAVRDLVMAVGAYTLGVLSETLEESRAGAETQAQYPVAASA